MCWGTPEKLGDLDIIVYLSFHDPCICTYTGDFGQVTMDVQLTAMEKPAHARARCTRLLNSKVKGLDTTHRSLAMRKWSWLPLVHSLIPSPSHVFQCTQKNWKALVDLVM